MDMPEDIKYLKSHEWVREDGDAYVVGITDFAQDQLGDVVFVELPAVGDRVTAGQGIAVVESVKTASEIYAPFDGEIVDVNSDLDVSPELLNSEPFEGGWMFRIRADRTPDGPEFLSADEYRKAIEDEA